MDDARRVDQLRAELARIVELADDLAGELAGVVASAAADVPDDEHDVEGSSIGFERARLGALLEATRQRRDAVATALAQAEMGATVRCRQCGTPLSTERLLALPGVTICVACSAAAASASRRPHR